MVKGSVLDNELREAGKQTGRPTERETTRQAESARVVELGIVGESDTSGERNMYPKN